MLLEGGRCKPSMAVELSAKGYIMFPLPKALESKISMQNCKEKQFSDIKNKFLTLMLAE